jgi:broad specificity phosphatase PhoE
MLRMFVSRHAESLANSGGYLSSAQPGPELTDLGRAQAHRWAASLRAEGISGVYCSPYRRTTETAQTLAALLDLEVIELDDLREFDIGDWEGRPGDDRDVRGHPIFRQWMLGDALDQRFQDGESALDVHDRAERAFARIAAETPEPSNVAVVTHGGFMAIALPLICPDAGAELRGIPANIEVRTLDFDGRNWSAAPRRRAVDVGESI